VTAMQESGQEGGDNAIKLHLADLLAEGHPASVVATIHFIEALVSILVDFSEGYAEPAGWDHVVLNTEAHVDLRATAFAQDFGHSDPPPKYVGTDRALLDAMQEMREEVLDRYRDDRRESNGS